MTIASNDVGFYLRTLCAQSLFARLFNDSTADSKPRRKPLQLDMYDHLSRALSYLDFIKNMHMDAPDIFAKCATSFGYVWLRDLVSAALPPNWSLLRICAVLDHRIKPGLPLSPISLTTRGRSLGASVVGTRQLCPFGKHQRHVFDPQTTSFLLQVWVMAVHESDRPPSMLSFSIKLAPTHPP